jgi:hypothetical protein
MEVQSASRQVGMHMSLSCRTDTFERDRPEAACPQFYIDGLLLVNTKVAFGSIVTVGGRPLCGNEFVKSYDRSGR